MWIPRFEGGLIPMDNGKANGREATAITTKGALSFLSVLDDHSSKPIYFGIFLAQLLPLGTSHTHLEEQAVPCPLRFSRHVLSNASVPIGGHLNESLLY